MAVPVLFSAMSPLFSASMIELPTCAMAFMSRTWMSLYCLFASMTAVVLVVR
jgi:hypothetical protein